MFETCLQVAEVAANAAAEVAWYFPNTREQYRIAGTLQIIQDANQEEDMQRVSHGSGSRLLAAIACSRRTVGSAFAQCLCPQLACRPI